jgi:phosphoglycerol transferase MdoB-like AlkP superfamily enzyme
VQDTQAAWLVLRVLPIVLVVILWLLGAKRALFRAMVLANVFLTIGLLASTLGLVYFLIDHPAASDSLLLSDVLLMAASNVLVFSIWYWIIDPPGIDESVPSVAPWDFLFPKRSDAIPQYEGWRPRYGD